MLTRRKRMDGDMMTSQGLTKAVLEGTVTLLSPKGSSSVIDENASPDHSIYWKVRVNTSLICVQWLMWSEISKNKWGKKYRKNKYVWWLGLQKQRRKILEKKKQDKWGNSNTLNCVKVLNSKNSLNYHQII